MNMKNMTMMILIWIDVSLYIESTIVVCACVCGWFESHPPQKPFFCHIFSSFHFVLEMLLLYFIVFEMHHISPYTHEQNISSPACRDSFFLTHTQTTTMHNQRSPHTCEVLRGRRCRVYGPVQCNEVNVLYTWTNLFISATRILSNGQCVCVHLQSLLVFISCLTLFYMNGILNSRRNKVRWALNALNYANHHLRVTKAGFLTGTHFVSHRGTDEFVTTKTMALSILTTESRSQRTSYWAYIPTYATSHDPNQLITRSYS